MKKWQAIQHKIFELPDLVDQVKTWKSNNQKVVFTNGCFDLLHQGHIDYLAKAADLGDKMILGVNADSSVKQLNKGPTRPIKDEHSRALILASLFFIDAVVLFSEDTPLQLIQSLQPDVLVKGGDYDPNEEDSSSKKFIVGSPETKAIGGEVTTIPFVPGFSSTSIEKKIIDLSNPNTLGQG